MYPTSRVPGSLLLAAVLAASLSVAAITARADARAAFAQVRPVVERSVVMVKVAAFPQVRVRGVIQPPRQFDLEGPATVIAPGVIVSSLSIFDPVKSLPPREGVEFSTTMYSKVEILVDGATWIEGRSTATVEGDDLIFFATAKEADAARLPALAIAAEPTPEVFADYLDVTRAPAAFERCAIARVSTITGHVPTGTFIFVTAQSAGSPVVDTNGAMLGLGVRVSGQANMPATSALMPAARVLASAREKGVLPAAVPPAAASAP
ncbi:MAG: hypothetical protein IAE82_01210 [Opitutaceae bacterium]|nr:hypothetical protein [Opitutaceae bacterium]